MSVNFSTNDYSYLFTGLTGANSSSSSSSSNLLSDYASIKNGSYGKLMKAYYSESKSKGSKASSKETVDNTAVKNLNKVQTATDALKESAEALTKKENIGYEDVKSFVDNYNSLISAANKVSDKSTVDRATRLVGDTLANYKLLGKIGITVNEDSTLSVDKDAFEKANKLTVESLFKGTGSYADKISSQSSLIKYSADRAVSKAGTYTAKGDYDGTTATGNLYNSYT